MWRETIRMYVSSIGSTAPGGDWEMMDKHIDIGPGLEDNFI